MTDKFQDDVDRDEACPLCGHACSLASERQEMMAGLELGKAMIDAAMLNPGKVDKDQMMEKLASLACPQRYKELSAADVRKMVVNHYTEKVSMYMARDFLNGQVTVHLPGKHNSYIDDLLEYWKSKGFKTTVSTNIDDKGTTSILVEW